MKSLVSILLVCLMAVHGFSIISTDPSIPSNACEGRPAIEEWIKQRKQISFQLDKPVLVTVSKVFNDDLKRLVHSSETYDQPYVILGLCDEWNGENLLQQFLDSLKSNSKLDLNKLLVLYSSPNNLFSNSPQNLVASYSENFPEGSVVFRGERFAFPKSIEGQVKSSQRYKYPNSQAFLGPASGLEKLFAEYPFDVISEPLYEIHTQKYFMESFMNLREKFKMQVDSGRKLFASLYGKDEDDSFQIRTKNGINSLIWRSLDTVTNELTDSHPVLVGDLPSSFLELASTGTNAKEGTYIRNLQKEEFGQAVLSPLNEREIRLGIDAKFNLGLLQNFFPSTSSSNSPHSSSASYSSIQVKESNKLLIALFLSDDDLFVRLILEGIENLDFPKEKTAIFINYKRTSEHFNADIEQWIEKIEKTKGTAGNYFAVLKSNEKDVSKAKREALLATVEHKCDYYFTTDAVLENKNTVRHLIEQKKKFIAPLLTLFESTYSNMWGEINWEKQGYKKHSLYPSIVGKEYVGVLRVPVVWGSFMIHSSLIPQIADNYLINPKSKINWSKVLDSMERFRAKDDWWIDLVFAIKCSFELDDGIWLSNKEYFGLLADKDEVTPEDNEKCDYDNPKVHKELFAYPNNKMLFKRYYYNPDFYNFAIHGTPVNFSEPCIDAFAFEFMRTTFGEHLIEEAENYGKWSGGGHKQQYDPRIGGTENYPTQDIHMNQMGFHEIWLDIIKTDVANVVDSMYGGIATKRYNIAFIVRYKPGAQASLNPHYDASLYTIAVALNKPGRDFQGGGIRYTRRNCTYVPPEAGYSIVHPGRMTHRHEGLETTAGTRYIFVTFVE